MEEVSRFGRSYFLVWSLPCECICWVMLTRDEAHTCISPVVDIFSALQHDFWGPCGCIVHEVTPQILVVYVTDYRNFFGRCYNLSSLRLWSGREARSRAGSFDSYLEHGRRVVRELCQCRMFDGWKRSEIMMRKPIFECLCFRES